MSYVLAVEEVSVLEATELFLVALAGARNKKTILWYRHKLKRLGEFLGDVPLAQVSIRQLERFRADLVGEMSPVTLGGYVRAIRRFFRWCVGEELIEVSPAVRMELPSKEKRPRYGVRDEDMEAMIASAPGLRERAILYFLRDTWVRAGGLCGLNVPSVDLSDCSAVVTEKYGLSRSVNFSLETADLLREYLGGRKKGPVFLNEKGKRLTIFTLYDLVKDCAVRAGLDVEAVGDEKVLWSPHQWRHAGVRSFLQSGAGSLGEASQLAGHSDIKVTHEFYGTFETSELKKVHRRWMERKGRV